MTEQGLRACALKSVWFKCQLSHQLAGHIKPLKFARIQNGDNDLTHLMGGCDN